MQFWQKNKELLILTILGIVMFFVYSYLPISQLHWQKENNVNLTLRFNTPDEVLNYYFSTQYAKIGELFYLEPLDKIMNRVIFPRWALVVGNKVTPGNFLGLDLIYGTIGKTAELISGLKAGVIIPFLTSFFAVIGVLFFYLLVKLFFEKSIAFISALLMFVFPGFWYYASRTMFNNILFLSLFLAGLYFLLKLIAEERRHTRGSTQKFALYLAMATGLCFGLALIVRTSEAIWVVLMVLMILIFYRKNFKNIWLYLLIGFIIFMACFLPVLYHNKILYDNYFSTGYPLNTVSSNLETGAIKPISPLQAVFLPFGFHPRHIVYVVYNYILKLFWPWAILFLAGVILFFRQEKTREQKLYFYLTSVIGYLILYYGSWIFYDSSLSNLISIGSSYVRYFLPIFVFGLPFIALCLVKIWQNQKMKLIFKIILFVIFFHYTLYIIHNTIFSGPESLPSVKNNLVKYNIQAESILKIVNKDDIILLDSSADKIVFPELKHIIVPQGGIEYLEIRKILNLALAQKVYYFHNNASVSADWLNENKFNTEELEVYDGENIKREGAIYKLKLKTKK